MIARPRAAIAFPIAIPMAVVFMIISPDLFRGLEPCIHTISVPAGKSLPKLSDFFNGSHPSYGSAAVNLAIADGVKGVRFCREMDGNNINPPCFSLAGRVWLSACLRDALGRHQASRHNPLTHQ